MQYSRVIRKAKMTRFCAALSLASTTAPADWGLGFGIWGSGFGVWGLGFGVWDLRFGVWGLGFGVWSLGV